MKIIYVNLKTRRSKTHKMLFLKALYREKEGNKKSTTLHHSHDIIGGSQSFLLLPSEQLPWARWKKHLNNSSEAKDPIASLSWEGAGRLLRCQPGDDSSYPDIQFRVVLNLNKRKICITQVCRLV